LLTELACKGVQSVASSLAALSRRAGEDAQAYAESTSGVW
jgi:hypothetical protein